VQNVTKKAHLGVCKPEVDLNFGRQSDPPIKNEVEAPMSQTLLYIVEHLIEPLFN